MLSNYLKRGRDPGWIELFFDLSYVLMLGRLAHLLFHTHDGVIEVLDIFNFMWIFSLAFIIWMYFTVFMNIYGNDTHRQNLLSFVLMIGLFAIVLFMHDIEHFSIPIGITIAIMLLFISLIYRMVKNRIPENKKYAEYKSNSLLIASILIVPMIFLPHIIGMVYIAVILMVEHFVDERMINKEYAAPPDGKHFIERIGVFMIILFGESFITLVNNLPDDLTIYDYLIAGLILLTVFCLWVNYYGYLEKLTEVKYHRYSQILLTNVFVMLGLTLLSAIIYHALHRELDLIWFKYLVMAFSINFYAGNGITYFRSGVHSRAGSIVYGIVPVFLTGLIFIRNVGYLGVVSLLFLVNLLTAVVIIVGQKKMDSKESTY